MREGDKLFNRLLPSWIQRFRLLDPSKKELEKNSMRNYLTTRGGRSSSSILSSSMERPSLIILWILLEN